MLTQKVRTALLGIAFLAFLLLSYVENTVFFQAFLTDIDITNYPLFITMLFIHNILVASLILLGMTFYVNLVNSNFFKREKHANVVLEHPRTFALIFAVMIVILSILRGSTLLGGIDVEALPLIIFISTPVGILEGFGIYLTINKTLSQNMTLKDLVYIYGVFLIAAIVEVGFINLLASISA